MLYSAADFTMETYHKDEFYYKNLHARLMGSSKYTLEEANYFLAAS